MDTENTQQSGTGTDAQQITTPIRNVNIVHREALTKLDILAAWITNRVGTMGFFFIIFTWTTGWLLWNTAAPETLRFDPYPAFVLWLFISNMIQIFLMPLLLIGQNLQEKYNSARAEVDFEVNVKAEKEIETILSNLEQQNGLIIKILQRMEQLETKH